MGFFDINYDFLRVQLLPVRLRKTNTSAWLKCLISPVKWLFHQFKLQRDGQLYLLSHNSQVVYLEAVLNDMFDPLTRGIYIEDGSFEDPVYAFLVSETHPIWVGLAVEAGTVSYVLPTALYTATETTVLGNSFLVKVPAAISFDADRMRALINKYRIAGKNIYGIELY
jgi:hypothetical protein